jgi:hypothetical protein
MFIESTLVVSTEFIQPYLAKHHVFAIPFVWFFTFTKVENSVPRDIERHPSLEQASCRASMYVDVRTGSHLKELALQCALSVVLFPLVLQAHDHHCMSRSTTSYISLIISVLQGPFTLRTCLQILQIEDRLYRSSHALEASPLLSVPPPAPFPPLPPFQEPYLVGPL